jgi:hypothetical protein
MYNIVGVKEMILDVGEKGIISRLVFWSYAV